MSELDGENEIEKPYLKSGIEEGDRILEVNGKTVSSTNELIERINETKGEGLNIKYIRDGEEKTAKITPAKVEKNEYKLGLWVRDTAAGVGTITFYEPSTKLFAALGHGIQDVDTDKLITIANGQIVTANIVNIRKGEKGKPGEIKGNIIGGQEVGEISKNTDFGIYGKLNNPTLLNINKSNEVEVAMRNEIKTGPAKIICSVENNIREEFDVEIQKIYYNNNENNKSMIVKVTDEKLLEKTGGIIQGMSGSPILQNGKFVGALTHVLVSEPSMGYAVFADIMIKQSREVE